MLDTAAGSSVGVGSVLHRGDCREVLATWEADSVDAIVTDPPSGIQFMGKQWDHDKGGREQWIAWLAGCMREALRVAKPGAHAVVWALPRTSHWTGMALEDAGWEIRDCVYHIFGSGFPKSANIGKHLDRMAGAEREVIGKTNRVLGPSQGAGYKGSDTFREANWQTSNLLTAPATGLARQWDGWGTALKPAVECWWIARKPLAQNPRERVTLTPDLLATWAARRCDRG